MVNITDITNDIETGINNTATALNMQYGFAVIPLIGDYQETPTARKAQSKEIPKTIINGGLAPISSPLPPIQGLGSALMRYTLDFLVKEKYASDVERVLKTYLENNNGAGVIFGDYVGTVYYDTLYVGDAAQRANVGASVPISITIYYQLIKGGMPSNSCKITMDGQNLHYLKCTIGKTKVLDTNNYLGKKNMLSVVTAQGISFGVMIPYLRSVLHKKIMTDLLDGGLNELYTVVYDDGFAEAKTYNMLLSPAEEMLEPGKIAAISFTLMEAATYGGE